MKKKIIILLVLLVLVLLTSAVALINRHFKRLKKGSLANQPTASQPITCQSMHANKGKLFCLAESQDRFAISQIDPSSGKPTVRFYLQPKINLQRIFWGKELGDFLIQDDRQKFWIARGQQLEELSSISAANWYGKNRLIAVNKSETDWQLAIFRADNLGLEKKLIDHLRLLPSQIYPSPKNEKLLLAIPTDIADEQLILLYQAGKTQKITASTSVKQAAWLDENQLLLLTKDKISVLNLSNKNPHTLLTNQEKSQLIFDFDAQRQRLALLDDQSNKIIVFDSNHWLKINQLPLGAIKKTNQVKLISDRSAFIISDGRLEKISAKPTLPPDN